MNSTSTSSCLYCHTRRFEVQDLDWLCLCYLHFLPTASAAAWFLSLYELHDPNVSSSLGHRMPAAVNLSLPHSYFHPPHKDQNVRLQSHTEESSRFLQNFGNPLSWHQYLQRTVRPKTYYILVTTSIRYANRDYSDLDQSCLLGRHAFHTYVNTRRFSGDKAAFPGLTYPECVGIRTV